MIRSDPLASPLNPSTMLIAFATPPIANPVNKSAATWNDSTQSTPGRSTLFMSHPDRTAKTTPAPIVARSRHRTPTRRVTSSASPAISAGRDATPIAAHIGATPSGRNGHAAKYASAIPTPPTRDTS